MKRHDNLFAGLFIGIGILVAGVQINLGIANLQDSQRIITVKGLSEKEFSADRVIWPILFKEVNNDLIALYDNIERNNRKVLLFLKENEIPEDQITVSPPDIFDYQTERYSSQDNKFRFNGTSTITVSSNQVEKIRNLIPQISRLIREGVAIGANRQYENPIRYEFAGLNDVKPGMIEEATFNARQSAEKFAKDSQSKLGKIKTASQGQMSISNRDDNSPHIKSGESRYDS
jgi:Uncharacterized protein conserved in bacteria